MKCIEWNKDLSSLGDGGAIAKSSGLCTHTVDAVMLIIKLFL